MVETSHPLEEYVADLLRSQGDVSRERPADYGKPLLLVSVRTLMGPQKVAVICADAMLSKDDLIEIQAGLSPMVNDGRIDKVLVVTADPIRSEIGNELANHGLVKHTTVEELLVEAVDFRSYIRGIIDSWRKRPDGLPFYAVKLRTAKGDDLDQLIRGWITAPTTAPVAILGSYGIGKSAFAAKLAHDLAEVHTSDQGQRIPILIRLGEIVHEQSLEGLLGRALTTGEAVRNFSFEIFQQLNHAGRLVILFDGFDEMKRGMTWEAFRYNLSELNRLVVGDSRVVLLGRPTAFLNDDEHRHALHGKRKFAGRYIKEQGWPEYREIRLGLLGRDQIDECAATYIRHQAQIKGERNTLRVDQRIERILRQIHDSHVFDIASRPVQLRMLLEVLPDWRRSLKELGVATLYDNFIDRNIAREAERPGRRRFNTRERRAFARDLAWWMWRHPVIEGGAPATRVSANAIPREIIEAFTAFGEDVEVARRDLVSACFLDRKLGGDLVFPHRSFQEFLVADHLQSAMLEDHISLGDLVPYITDEVSSFLGDLLGPNLPATLDNALRRFKGSLPWRFLRLWIQSSSHEQLLRERAAKEVNHRDTFTDRELAPWWSLLLTLGSCKQIFEKNLVPILEARLSQSVQFPKDAALHLLCLLLLAENTRNYDIVSRALTIACRVGRVRTVYSDALPNRPYRVVSRSRGRAGEEVTIFEPPEVLMTALNRANAFVRRGTRLLNIRGMQVPLLEATRDYCSMAEAHDVGSLARLDLAFPGEFAPSEWAFWDELVSYQRDFPAQPL